MPLYQTMLKELEQRLSMFHEQYLYGKHVQYRFCIMTIQGKDWSDTWVYQDFIQDFYDFRNLTETKRRIEANLEQKGDRQLEIYSRSFSVGNGVEMPMPLEAHRQLCSFFQGFDLNGIYNLPQQISYLKKESPNMAMTLDAKYLRTAEQMDKEYLAQPLVEGVQYEITDNCVRIFCDHTVYVSVKLEASLDRQQLLALYQSVLRKAKAAGVSVSYSNHYRRTITERWKEYQAEKERQRKLFAQIAQQAAVIRSRGLHYGTVNDRELDKLSPIVRDFIKTQWTTSVLSVMWSVFSRLQELDGVEISDYSRICL